MFTSSFSLIGCLQLTKTSSKSSPNANLKTSIACRNVLPNDGLAPIKFPKLLGETFRQEFSRYKTLQTFSAPLQQFSKIFIRLSLSVTTASTFQTATIGRRLFYIFFFSPNFAKLIGLSLQSFFGFERIINDAELLLWVAIACRRTLFPGWERKKI